MSNQIIAEHIGHPSSAHMRFAHEVRFLLLALTIVQDESLFSLFGSKKEKKRLHSSKSVRPSSHVQVTTHVLCFRSPLLLLPSRPSTIHMNGAFPFSLSISVSFTTHHVLSAPKHDRQFLKTNNNLSSAHHCSHLRRWTLVRVSSPVQSVVRL